MCRALRKRSFTHLQKKKRYRFISACAGWHGSKFLCKFILHAHDPHNPLCSSVGYLCTESFVSCIAYRKIDRAPFYPKVTLICK